MININEEYFNSPYYFLIREKDEKYSVYFSINKTITEARDKDDVVHFNKKNINKVKNFIKNTIKTKKKTSTKKIKGEIEELVGADGGMLSSKLPILDKPRHTHKTMDQIVPTSRQTNDPVTRGYRTYYGESIDDTIEETNLSDTYGYRETQNMDGKKTYNYFVKKMGVEPDEAKKRTKEFGKDPTGKKSKTKKKGSFDKLTLSEIQKDNVLKMVEDILMNDKKTNDEIMKKKLEENPFISKNIKTLKAQAEKQGLSISDLIKMIKNEQ
ncbi:MAG: hypothetical protein K9I82_12285 [Chitinophagaceae bacterium]|nr:hypothetical protein [Chitinophagaceae bacterium]